MKIIVVLFACYKITLYICSIIINQIHTIMTFTITDNDNYYLEAFNEKGQSVSCAVIEFDYWEVERSENIIACFLTSNYNQTDEDPRDGVGISKELATEFVTFANETEGYKLNKLR